MKYYVADFNGVLTDLKARLAGHLASPRDADVWVVWQDCQGSYKNLIQACHTTGFRKPTYVVQHGRAATSDYGPPNNFKLLADKFLCWGKADAERLASLHYSDDRYTIVGCPLNTKIKPRVKHSEKVVLFCPVSTGKEEPENVAVYYELLKIKYNMAKQVVLANRDQLKDVWGFDGKKGVTFNEIACNFDIIAKVLPWHESQLYHGNVIKGFQDDPKNINRVYTLLQNVDAVVGLDEGCLEVFAFSQDVPVVIVDGFKYRQHQEDGHYELMDIYRTKAARHCTIDELNEAVNEAIDHPEVRRDERAEVAERELGLSYGDATANILKVIRNDAAKDFSSLR